MYRIWDIFRKERDKPIIGLSIHDSFGAHLVNSIQEVDFAIVGDSLAMTFKGCRDVKCVTLDEMIYHYNIVRDIIENKPVFLDLPISTYERIGDLIRTLDLLEEMDIKYLVIEGDWPDSLRVMSDRGFNYIVHLGYKPKYDPSPTVVRDYMMLWREVSSVLRYNPLAIKLELVSRDLTSKLRREVNTPILGTGAGGDVDGHILVLYDFIGMSVGFRARFVRKYVDIYKLALNALGRLVSDIINGEYPSQGETYS